MTSDPLNYVLESLQTHLIANVTDPRTSRASTSEFVLIGNLLANKTVEYPYIILNPDSTQSVLASVDGRIDSTQSAETQNYQVTVLVVTDRHNSYSSNSKSKLCRNLGSQIINALTRKSQMQTLKTNYDFQKVSLIGGGRAIYNDETNEWQLPLTINIEFLYIYNT